jgi:hypothetical protein
MTERPKNTMRRDLMLMIGLPFVLVVGLFFSCLGSGKFAGASDLIALSQGLMTEFHLPGASVGMSGGGQMTVTLSGVTFAGLDSTEGAAKAKAIALYARAHWQGTEPITSVAIKLSTSDLRSVDKMGLLAYAKQHGIKLD